MEKMAIIFCSMAKSKRFFILGPINGGNFINMNQAFVICLVSFKTNRTEVPLLALS